MTPNDAARFPHSRAQFVEFLLGDTFRGLPLKEATDQPNLAELAKMAYLEYRFNYSFFDKPILNDPARRAVLRETFDRKIQDHYGQAQHLADLIAQQLIASTLPAQYDDLHFFTPLDDEFEQAKFFLRGISPVQARQWWRTRSGPLSVADAVRNHPELINPRLPNETVLERYAMLIEQLSPRAEKSLSYLRDTGLVMLGHAYTTPNFIEALRRDVPVVHHKQIPGRITVRVKTHRGHNNTLWNKIGREVSEYLEKHGITRPQEKDIIAMWRSIKIKDIAGIKVVNYVAPEDARKEAMAVASFIKTNPEIKKYYPWPGVYSAHDKSDFEENDYDFPRRPQGRVKLQLGTGIVLPEKAKELYGIETNSDMRIETIITDITFQMLCEWGGPRNHAAFENHRNRFWTDNTGKEHKFSKNNYKANIESSTFRI